MQSEVSKRLYLLVLVLLVAGNVALYYTILTPSVLEVKALEVGEKGSATLVRTASGATILIDTGPDASVLRALGSELPPWQRTIDVVLLTSEKASAKGGLPDVLKRYRVLHQVALTRSQRLTLGADTYIDIVITKNAPAGVSLLEGGKLTEIR